MRSLEEIAELRVKYVEMRAMRLADHDDSGASDLGAVRARMADLAARFPGALREIDVLELAEISRRIVLLEAVAAGALEVEPWMQAMTLFHRWARGALWAKRWLRGRQDVTPAIEAAYAVEAANVEGGVDALSWRSELATIARPPGGRVIRLVYSRMARALGVSDVDARLMVFGPERSARGSGRRWP